MPDAPYITFENGISVSLADLAHALRAHMSSAQTRYSALRQKPCANEGEPLTIDFIQDLADLIRDDPEFTMTALAKRQPASKPERHQTGHVSTSTPSKTHGPVDSSAQTPFGMTMNEVADAFREATLAEKQRHQDAGRLPRTKD